MEIFHNPEFWVLVGFLTFFILLGRTLWKVMRDGLDGRAAKIQEQLNEAAQLRAEAESLLNLYRSKQEQAVRDAEDILAQAKTEAELMRKNAEADLKRSLAAREAQAKDRIALAEQAAIQQVKARAVDIAIRAATGLVKESIDQSGAAALVDHAIDDLPQRAKVA
jgi:F-type H+-transporting ATPase subunit b